MHYPIWPQLVLDTPAVRAETEVHITVTRLDLSFTKQIGGYIHSNSGCGPFYPLYCIPFVTILWQVAVLLDWFKREKNCQSTEMGSSLVMLIFRLNVCRRGSRKFCQGGPKIQIFFCFSHHILQRGEGISTNIISGPPSAGQRNAMSLAFRWWADDGTR